MITTVHPAFGYVILKQQIPANTAIYNEPVNNGVVNITDLSKFGKTSNGFIWLHTSGEITFTNVETGEVQTRNPGHCNINVPEKLGIFKVEVIKDATVFCFNGDVNIGKPPLPAVECFSLLENSTTELSSNTKLFLADGSITVDNQTFTGPKQIKVGDIVKNVTANTNCYGYIFP
jgi:hypothetical protein